jgi:predicted transcriptional regulator
MNLNRQDRFLLFPLVHIYKLTKPLPDILRSFEQEKMKQVETIKSDLDDLNSLIKDYERL